VEFFVNKNAREGIKLDGTYVMKRYTAHIVIRSTASALQNKMTTLDVIGGVTAAGPKRNDQTDEAIARPKLYRGPNNEMGWPAINMIATIVNGGKHIQMKRGNAKRQAALTKAGGQSDIGTILRPLPGVQFFPFSNLDEKGEVPWVPNVSRTVNPQTGGSNRTVRPEIPSWECELDLQFNDELNPETIAELIRKGGEKSGLGDFRPSAPNKPGMHGTFALKSFTITDIEEVEDVVAVTYTPAAEAKRAALNGRSNGHSETPPRRATTPAPLTEADEVVAAK